MPSEFAGLERLVSEAVDATMGEPTRVVPRANGTYFSGPADGARAPITIAGVVDYNPVTIVSKDTGKYDGMRPVVAGDRLHVSYDVKNFPDWKPREGDVIELIDRPGSPSANVSRVDPDGLGRIVCVCTPRSDET